MSLSSLRWFKGMAALSAAAVFTVAGGAAALADDIYNNLDGSIDATAESMTLTAGGSTGATTLAVLTTNTDGKSGCNLTGSTTLVTAVSSSNAAVATVSPSSLTFDSCGATRTVTVTPLTVGTTTVSLSLTSNNSGGTFDLAPATFVVTVNSAKKATTTTVSCPTSTAYTGSALTPCTATASDTSGFSQSLPVTYSSNTDAGTATASASFAGDATHLSSSGSTTFTIAKASSATTVTCPAKVSWTGTGVTPCSAVVTGAGGLNQSLTVGYTNNTDVGTANASASYAGDTNHQSSSDAQSFTIDKAAATVSVTCAPGTYTYTGSAQSPCTAKVTGTGLDQTLPVVYDDNTDAGLVTASASFAGDATHAPASGSATFTIGRATAVCDVKDFTGTYDGAAHGLSGSCTGLAGVDLSAGLDLGAAFTDAGGHTAVWAFDGGTNYADQSGSGSVSIGKADTTTAVTCPGSVTYDGSAQKPCSAEVTGAGGLSKVLSVDYADNIDTGTATASAGFAGDANHNGSNDSTTFEIAKADTETTVTCPDGPFVYSSLPITPGCTATTTGSGGLSASPTVTFANNVNAGVATASASYGGDANHKGSTGSATFAIDKAGSSVSLICESPVTYTGKPLAVCSASASGVGMTLPVQLPVDYTKNTDAGAAGASATWDGDGNHNGSTGNTTFTILPASSTTVVSCPASAPFTGSALTPCHASVTGAGGLDEPLAVHYEKNVHAGTATASASYAGDDNHLASEDTTTFTIDKAATVTSVTCTGAPFTYTGSAITPCTATVTGAGGLDESLTVLYAGNTSAGTATASASYPGDDDHLDSSDSKTFTIDKAASSTTLSCPGHVTFAGVPLTPCSAQVTGAGGLTQSVAVVYGDNLHAGTATAKATYGGDDNHLSSTDNGTFTIDKAGSTTTVTCTAGPFVFTGSTITPCSATVTGIGGLSQSATVSYQDNVHVGTASASASFAGDGDHEPSSGSTRFTILKADTVTTVTCPTSVNWTGSPITPCSASVTGPGGLNEVVAVSYVKNVDAGTATATAGYAGSGDYNASSGSATFKIASWWTAKGFYQPVDMGSVVNTVKAGSTVPLKFELFAGSTELTATSAVKTFTTALVTCDSLAATTDEIEVTTTGGTSLRYDTTGGQYIQNWQTPRSVGNCYRATMTAQDGTSIAAFFKLK